MLTARRLAELHAEGRPAAWRLLADPSGTGETVVVPDRVMGVLRGAPDDVVLQRNDGVPAYHLAVVVDDAAQGVTEVVRADDLATATPRQVTLQRVLGLTTPTYAHVPLVFGADGERLAKRHGAVTAGELRVAGASPARVLAWLAASAGLAGAGGAIGTARTQDVESLLAAFVEAFDWSAEWATGHVSAATIDALCGPAGDESR